MSHIQAPVAATGPACVPPLLSGGLPILGHLRRFSDDPVRTIAEGRRRHGEAFMMRLLRRRVAVLTGPEANAAVFRAPDETLSPREAYRLMTPIFGKGIAYDAEPHVMAEQLAFLHPAVRDDRLHAYVGQMTDEIERFISDWPETGEFELANFCNRLTMFISSRCLLGHEFRERMNEEFTGLYQTMERSLIPLAYVFPNLPLPVFRRRNRARRRMVRMIAEIINERRAARGSPSDLLQTLIEARYEDGRALTEHEITGLLLTIIFAGHHTTATLAAWSVVELLQRPDQLTATIAEQETVFADERSITFDKLKRLEHLERFIMEAERLHPPIVVMIRKAIRDFHFKQWRIPRDALVMVSPAVSNRSPELFEQPDLFDPDRFTRGRAEHRKHPFAITTFGGGAHRCIGQHFAYLQIKTLLSVLLRCCELELTADEVRPSYDFMVVGPASPCMLRYRITSRITRSSRDEGMQVEP